jgi:hypothetical protein
MAGPLDVADGSARADRNYQPEAIPGSRSRTAAVPNGRGSYELPMSRAENGLSGIGRDGMEQVHGARPIAWQAVCGKNGFRPTSDDVLHPPISWRYFPRPYS